MKKKQMMAKTLLVAMASAGAVSAAHAQSSVTLYGVVDNAFAYANNQKGHSNFYLTQGILYASKLGFRGSEDLGGGNHAIFDLQAGFNTLNGAQASSGLIFNRQAFVGLQNDHYGQVTIGRQYTPYFLLVGPAASSAALTGATGAHPGDLDALDTTVRVNNAVTFTSANYNGLVASAQYGFGGIAGSTGLGQTISAALSYNRGPLALAAGYLRLDGVGQANNFGTASTGQFGFSAVTSGYESARAIQMAALAANYTFGNMRVGAQYTNVKYLPGSQSLFTNTEVFNTYGTFATYRFTPTFDVAAGYSYTVASKANGIEDSAKYQQVSLKQAYHLSKRTTIYTLQAYQHASGQTLGTAGIGDIVNATPDVGDAESSTPSSTSGQFVAIVGLNVTF